MRPFAKNFIYASLCFGALLVSGAGAQEIAAREYVVEAIATDIQSAVIRDPLGNDRRYGTGDLLAEGEWRLIWVGAGSLKLRAKSRLQGRPVELVLHEGDGFDPLASSATIQRESEPVHDARRMVQDKSAERRAKRD